MKKITRRIKYSMLLAFVLLTPAFFYWRIQNPNEFSDMYTFGDTFVFNDMSITLSNSVEWLNTTSNTEDGYNEFRIPIEVTNLYRHSNRITVDYFTIFCPNGVAQPKDWWPRRYDDIIQMPRIRNGVSLNAYMYFLYDGIGNYIVEFRRLAGWDNLEPVEVWIPIR